MSGNEKAVWVWRGVVVALLFWIGWNVQDLARGFPPGLDYNTEEYLRRIEKTLDQAVELLRLRPR